MKCSIEMAEKVKKFEILQKEANELYEEIKQYFENELDADGFELPFITDKPIGTLQNNNEYCDQTCLGEDWYTGTYYHQIEGSNEYVGYSFEM